MRLDRKYSHYRNDSLIAKIGKGAGYDASIEVDTETANLLDFAAQLHRQSDGSFDITAGSLTALWDLQSGHLPCKDDISHALEKVGWSKVEWQRPCLRLTVTGMRLDLGGLVKEYAADRCATLCRAAGVRHGIVDMGGDLALIGPHVDGQAWQIGIKAPHAPEQAAAHIALTRGGLATSGDYERAMVIDGRRYSHIIDPRTGWPIESFASVSVLAESCLVAGSATTLAMLMGIQAGRIWLDELGLPYFCIDAKGTVSGTIAPY